MSQDPPKPRFKQKKVQKEDFLKEESRELKSFFVLALGSYESLESGYFFWQSNNLYKQCEAAVHSNQ